MLIIQLYMSIKIPKVWKRALHSYKDMDTNLDRLESVSDPTVCTVDLIDESTEFCRYWRNFAGQLCAAVVAQSSPAVHRQYPVGQIQ